MKTAIGVVLLLCAYGLLFPGLTLPILTLSGTVEKVKLVDAGRQLIQESPNTPALVNNLVDMVADTLEVSGSIDAFNKTRSILGTAEELYTNNHVLVAVLIITFSVIVPLIKALVLICAVTPIKTRYRQILLAISNNISKWSMADVFVIAIFIAFLAGNGIRENNGLVDFEATLGRGFWYFLCYCLISILGTQVLCAGVKDTLQQSPTNNETSPGKRINSGEDTPDDTPEDGQTDASKLPPA